MKKKVTAIIQARLNSTRLPGKTLKSLNGIPLIAQVINRIKNCKLVDKVVLATVDNEINLPLQKLSKDMGIDFFAGSDLNVLERYFLAAEKFGGDFIVRVTGDNPLTDTSFADRAISGAIKTDADIYSMSGLPLGTAVEVIKRKALVTAYNLSSTAYHFEHVTPYIKENENDFTIIREDSKFDNPFSELRLTVDTEDDFKLMKKIFDNFTNKKDFSLSDVINYLKQNPKLVEINSHVEQRPMTHWQGSNPLNPKKGDFKNKKIAIITDWDEDLGSGHIQRMATVAKSFSKITNLDISIINNKDINFLKNFPKNIVKSKIDGNEDLIICDKRDSTIIEISELNEIAKTVVIDDNGEGRNVADFKIDLLPNIRHDDAKILPLVYGYNFVESLNELKGKTIYKKIDVVFYAGFNPPKSKLEKLISIIPDNLDYVVLNGEDSFSIISGVKSEKLNKTYAEYILSSKILISHFGITLYEADLCNTKSFVVNPTSYHSELTDKVKNSINLGLLDDIDIKRSKKLIQYEINNYKAQNVSVDFVIKKVNARIEGFVNFVLEL